MSEINREEVSDYQIDGRPATYDEVFEDMMSKNERIPIDGTEGSLELLRGGPSLEDYMTPEALARQQAEYERHNQEELQEFESASRGEGRFYNVTSSLAGLPTKRSEITSFMYYPKGREPRVGERGVIAVEPIEKSVIDEIHEALKNRGK